MRRLVGPQAPCGPVRSAAPGMSLIEMVRGLALVSWMGLAVHADVAAVPGGERHRSPVDALADGRAALPERLCRRRMAEQSVLRQRWLVDALFAGGFGGGMAHMAPGDTGQQWTRRSATHRSAAPYGTSAIPERRGLPRQVRTGHGRRLYLRRPRIVQRRCVAGCPRRGP